MNFYQNRAKGKKEKIKEYIPYGFFSYKIQTDKTILYCLGINRYTFRLQTVKKEKARNKSHKEQ